MNEQSRHDTIEVVVEIPPEAVPDTMRTLRVEPDLSRAIWICDEDVFEVEP